MDLHLRGEIEKDFNDHIEYLNGQKITTKVRFHRKRAGIIGSLMFLADLADKNGFPDLFTILIQQATFVRSHPRGVEQMFNENWLHNERDVTKMKPTFLCDIARGYNAARDQYSKKYTNVPPQNVPSEMPLTTCTAAPEVKKAINKLMEKLVKYNAQK